MTSEIEAFSSQRFLLISLRTLDSKRFSILTEIKRERWEENDYAKSKTHSNIYDEDL